ncbi:DUF5330 domain-containing protein [Phyllobacterium endophyticum]|uniref:DUF5330 domain-containing protein n=1 Tax=Phyllobacterium endophyticum TaxID=1149773 RepID=UPI0011CA5F4C|nr:DUF5330 domain-containing protein [Phyllobacterium endophyticum]TXR49843.1 hypothetical protein FVA77_07455 [Phyllobacterium endophyticum]
MFFLIRFAIKFCFWMMLISLFIPVSPENRPQGAAQPGPIEAFLAAQETISDLSDFCTRKPQACETGKAALSSASARAGEVAKVGYDYLDARLGENAKKPGTQESDARSAEGDAIKAKLREMALREILDAATRQREQANEIDDKTRTGTVSRN